VVNVERPTMTGETLAAYVTVLKWLNRIRTSKKSHAVPRITSRVAPSGVQSFVELKFARP